MRKSLCAVLVWVVLLSGCAGDGTENARFRVVCTTYPIYLFASALTSGVEGVAVERLDTGSTSCLHDYTLSVNDMKKLEQADVIALNGAGLEEFLEDALAASRAQIVDCSQGIELLENPSHHHEEEDEHGHDHGHWDPHYWMDLDNARAMAANLRNRLILLDPDHAAEYEDNAQRTDDALAACQRAAEEVWAEYAPRMETPPALITFHDGFRYFAESLGVELLASIEEEAGSEASAKEIVEITGLVKEYRLPVIFTEVNGSDATARAVARETGCDVQELDMLMDGPDVSGLEPEEVCDYFHYGRNVETVINGFAGKKEAHP